MNNEYPKNIWVLTRARVILEGDVEVIDHTSDQPIAGTFDVNVAELVAAVFKEHQGNKTMVMSDVNPLPTAVLNAMLTANDNDIEVDRLMDMFEV